MNLKKCRIWIIALLVLISLILALRLMHKEPAEVTSDAGMYAITTTRPEHVDFTERGQWFGTVKARGRVQVIAFKAAQIDTVAAVDGSRVKKGDTLFIFNDPVVKAQLKGSQQTDAPATEEQQFLADSLQLKAPTAGVFTRRRVSAGQMVSPGDLLAEIMPLDRLYIRATLFPADNINLTNCEARILTASGEETEGAVVSILPERTAEGATVVWIEASDSAQRLHPGESVSGTVLYSLHTNALCVPADAVIQDEKEQSWVLIKRDGQYQRQRVQTGLTAGGLIEITAGLNAEDSVVVKGAYGLFHQDFNRLYKVVD